MSMSSDILEKVEGVTECCPTQAPWVHYVSEEEAVGHSFPVHCTPTGHVPQPPLQRGSKVCRLLHFVFHSQPLWHWDYWLQRLGVWTFISNLRLTHKCWQFSALYWGRRFVFFFSFPPVCALKWNTNWLSWWDPLSFSDSLCQLTCFLKLKAFSFVYIYKRQRYGVWR